MADNPDEIKWHEPHTCMHCDHSLAETPIEGYKRRQVVDIPLPRLIFTEHRVAIKCCPNCNMKQQAAFPGNVKAPIQYGDSWNAWCAYLNSYQHLPLERISQLFEDLTGHRPSEATLLSHLEKLSIQLEPIERLIRQNLLDSKLVHADETGMRIEGKLHMQILLRESLKERKKALEAERPLNPEAISNIETRYDEILSRGAKEWRPPLKSAESGKRGRKAKSKAANLAERFILYKADILRFLQNALVPFDNSQAERDIRMVKVKEKVSGSFRTQKGAIQFARIRGFISTMRKQGRNLLDSIILVGRGQFFLTDLSSYNWRVIWRAYF
ncbi:transposase [Aneurinibacillus sp. Ricciae_BoGa-3]|uniref:IS66 family transposase n=1 Tax=Aneurinibacillus sp. Ricciae_BoGa-3 TaxID=3022697 RepID=UPI0023401CA9|nr:transposase [Aneurinibacillus sp. Ricciae_BoGa-3]WCK54814.1 transposase [Aneurinibacillus sp. Ricciae_BoGa-3]